MRLKFLSLLVFIFILSIFLAGCGSGKAGSQNAAKGKSVTPVTITMWTTSDGKPLKQLVSEFNKTHPNIHVNSQFIAQPDGMLKRLTTSLKTGSQPNIMFGGNPTWGPLLMKSNKIVFLQDKLAKTDKEIYPGMLSSMYYKGKQFAIPFEGGDYALFYNKTDFKKAGISSPPNTWKELIKDAKKLSDPSKNHYGIYVPFGDAEWTVYTWESMLWGNGGQFLNKNKTKATFNSPAGVKGLKTWVDLIYKYHAAPKTSYATPDSSDGSSAFASHAVSMLIDGSWDIQNFNKAGINYGIAMMPKGTKSRATNTGIGSIFVFKKNKQQVQASIQFLKWFMQPKHLANYYIATGARAPVTKAVYSIDAFKKFLNQKPKLKVFAKMTKYAHSRPTLLSYNAISSELGTEINKALHHQESPAKALNAAAKKANAILKKNGE